MKLQKKKYFPISDNIYAIHGVQISFLLHFLWQCWYFSFDLIVVIYSSAGLTMSMLLRSLFFGLLVYFEPITSEIGSAKITIYMVYKLYLLEVFAVRYGKVSNMCYILMNVLLNVFGVSMF